MCKRSCCMAPSESCAQRPADERPAACDAPAAEYGGCDKQTATAAAGRPASKSTSSAEAAEKKKGRAADEADGGEQLRRTAAATAGEESARERLKRHRTEMAGRVRIPELWGQERLLKDWVDCAVFDRPLAATRGLLTARDALVAECAAAPPPARSGCRTAALKLI